MVLYLSTNGNLHVNPWFCTCPQMVLYLHYLSTNGNLHVHRRFSTCPLIVLYLSSNGNLRFNRWFCTYAPMVLYLSANGSVPVHQWFCTCLTMVLYLSTNGFLPTMRESDLSSGMLFTFGTRLPKSDHSKQGALERETFNSTFLLKSSITAVIVFSSI